MGETKLSKSVSQDIYNRQGFGQPLSITPPAALLIVDFSNGFTDSAVFGGGNIGAAVQISIELLRLARKWRWPICYSRTVFADDGSDANLFAEKVPGNLLFTEDSPESQIVVELSPIKGELVVRKQFPSAFFATPLASWLAMQGVKTLVVAGATTSGCVRASVVDAMCFGFRPIVVEDCVGDRSIEQHESNLFDMKMKYAEVMKFEAIKNLSEFDERV